MNSNEAVGLLDRYRIIDTDAHYTEPPDLWTSRVPETMKEKVPHVKRVDGVDRWFVGGDQDFGSVGLCIVDREGKKHYDRGVAGLSTFDECHVASYNVKERVALMDELGIWAQIIYPNTGGISSSVLVTKVQDNDLRKLCVELYNDAAAEVQRDSGGRLVPMGLLPMWDMKAMADEAQRCIEDLGLRGFTVADKPEFIGLPSFLDPHWGPFLEICNTAKASLNFHIGGDPSASPLLQFPWDDYGPETKVAIWTCLFSMSNARTIANWCYSGLLDKYRDLKLVSVESGIGWIPYLLEAMEYQLDEMMPNEGQKLQRRPKEYFRDHFYTTFWFESFGPSHVEAIGPDNVMIETDFPHPTCLFPHHDHLTEVAKGWSEETRRKVLQDNAAQLYRIELPIS
jgi:predicted TIM-barrel fold metal-dependent hydrolase